MFERFDDHVWYAFSFSGRIDVSLTSFSGDLDVRQASFVHVRRKMVRMNDDRRLSPDE